MDNIYKGHSLTYAHTPHSERITEMTAYNISAEHVQKIYYDADIDAVNKSIVLSYEGGFSSC